LWRSSDPAIENSPLYILYPHGHNNLPISSKVTGSNLEAPKYRDLRLLRAECSVWYIGIPGDLGLDSMQHSQDQDRVKNLLEICLEALSQEAVHVFLVA
jgi:hypothetical protein